ncbi:Polysaccharide biosynthesis/export protein [Rubripirellula amarantea]|uniref:Polysaccharide biosynthesis/export protein n=1 Tax=Rubripirellula amarantea TaxID=2527999 RepID=A0A5C5WS72_9BACT|nr:polysaccharide biosynthesis/export family protein [Rubripirellula amarantea]TWT53368.1 Polysaccharide biosynthesis/export protein [Rubripirellula amarantea]
MFLPNNRCVCAALMLITLSISLLPNSSAEVPSYASTYATNEPLFDPGMLDDVGILVAHSDDDDVMEDLPPPSTSTKFVADELENDFDARSDEELEVPAKEDTPSQAPRSYQAIHPRPQSFAPTTGQPAPAETYSMSTTQYAPATMHYTASVPMSSSGCKCGQCMTCADRNGQGMIGGAGMKLGVGPKCNDDCQCWQCPYDAPFSVYGPGEYAGPARTHRVAEYRLRTGDTIQMTFLITAMKSEGSYRLVVGDELLIESEADKELTRGSLEKGLRIQPDGTITLRLIGQVYAAGQTIDQLRGVLEEKYTEFYPEPAIDVTPVNTGNAAQQIRQAISGAGGFDPQQIQQTITPAGEIRLPKIGAVQAQGLTLDELKQEINLRYDRIVGGLEVEPSLQSQAAHNIFVLGEVRQPGRYNLDNTPTTVIGAIAMAGGYVPGANLRQVVIFRRGDNWELISTLVDVRGAILGREAHPRDEIWIRDGDVIILPSTPIRLFDNFVRQVFTEGIYGVIPISATYNLGDTITR